MASFSDSLKLTIDIVTGNAKSGLADLKSEISGAEGAWRKMKVAGTGAFDVIKGNALAVVGGLAGAAVGIAHLADAAGDLQETVSAGRVVFGDAAEAVEKFGATAATSLGISKREAIDAATTFGVFGKQAGLSGQDLSDFSIKMVALAGDFASFKNTSPEEAIQAIGAAMRGESEPIRRYGILLDDAALKHRAMTLGIYTGTGALTSQQRVLAAQAEILAQSSDAQGDFARTSDSLANKQRVLSAQWEDMQATLGKALVPAMGELVETASQAIGPLSKVTQALTELNKASQPPADKPLGYLDLPEHIIKKPLDFKGNIDLLKRSFEESTGATAANIDATVNFSAALNEWVGVAEPAPGAISAINNALSGMRDATAGTSDALSRQQVNLESSQAAIDGWAKIQQEAADQAKRVNDKLAEQADKFNAQVDAARNSADATRNAEDAQRTFAEKAQAAADAVHQHGKNSTEAAAAERDEADAAIASAGAAQENATKHAEAAGQFHGATAKLDDFNASLLSNARFATPAAREAIARYITEANNIPESESTEIRAAIARGDFDTAARLLTELSAARRAAVTADANTGAAEYALNVLARPRTAFVNVQYGGGSVPTLIGYGAQTRRAAGGPVRKGEPYWVGEHGPEPFVPDQNGTIIPAGASSKGGSAIGGDTYHVTFSPTIVGASNPEATVAALESWVRRNGPQGLTRRLKLA